MVTGLAAERPLVLLVDDAQWADEPSRRFLAFLAKRIDGVPILLAVATRPQHDDPALSELTTDPEARVLSPTALTAEGTRAFLARANIDPAFAGACHASTGGNPFYLGELARELPAPNVTALGPRTIAAAVKRRLDPEALKLARAVAVLGDGADPATAKALADIEDYDTAARALAAAGVLEQGLTFAHPIVRSAVYADIPREERANAHAAPPRCSRTRRARNASPRTCSKRRPAERPAHRRHAARRGPPGARARRREQCRRVPRPRAEGAAARGPARRAAHRAGRGRVPRGHRHRHRPARAGDRARDGRADPHPRRDRARARAQVPGRVRARGADPEQRRADGPLGEELEIERLGLAYLSVAARAATTLPRHRPERRRPRPGSKRSPSPRSRSTRARAATTPPASPTSPAAPWPATCSRPTRWAAATA